MAELEAEGVEHESRHSRALPASVAVALLSENRKADFGQLHPNLVFAPRPRTGFDEEPAGQRLEETKVGLGLLDDTRPRRDAPAHAPLSGWSTWGESGEGMVGLHDPPLRELPGEGRVHGAVLREQDDAGRIAIQALVDAQSDALPGGRPRCAISQERGEEPNEVGPPRIHGLVGGKPGWLAHGHEPRVLEEDVRGPQDDHGAGDASDALGTQRRLEMPSGGDREARPAQSGPLHPHRAGHDPTTNLGARDLSPQSLTEPLLRALVEASPVVGRRHSAGEAPDQGGAGAQRPSEPSCSQGRKPAL